jgi:hypothetical protein
VNQHALHTEAGQRFQGESHGQSIGNRDFDSKSVCLPLAVQVFEPGRRYVEQRQRASPVCGPIRLF